MTEWVCELTLGGYLLLLLSALIYFAWKPRLHIIVVARDCIVQQSIHQSISWPCYRDALSEYCFPAGHTLHIITSHKEYPVYDEQSWQTAKEQVGCGLFHSAEPLLLLVKEPNTPPDPARIEPPMKKRRVQ